MALYLLSQAKKNPLRGFVVFTNEIDGIGKQMCLEEQ